MAPVVAVINGCSAWDSALQLSGGLVQTVVLAERQWLQPVSKRMSALPRTVLGGSRWISMINNGDNWVCYMAYGGS